MRSAMHEDEAQRASFEGKLVRFTERISNMDATYTTSRWVHHPPSPSEIANEKLLGNPLPRDAICGTKLAMSL